MASNGQRLRRRVGGARRSDLQKCDPVTGGPCLTAAGTFGRSCGLLADCSPWHASRPWPGVSHPLGLTHRDLRRTAKVLRRMRWRESPLRRPELHRRGKGPIRDSHGTAPSGGVSLASGGNEPLFAAVSGGVSVGPVCPDDADPAAGQDPGGVWVSSAKCPVLDGRCRRPRRSGVGSCRRSW